MTQPGQTGPPQSPLEPIAKAIADGVGSPHSKRAYRSGIRDFIRWLNKEGGPHLPLTKRVVQSYRLYLEASQLAPASINVRLCAIRKLAGHAEDCGLIEPGIATAIARVRGVRQMGRRIGNWLTPDSASRLLETPDQTTLRGKRDRVILALLLGCGLRRQEAVAVEFQQIGLRDGRWVIIDLVGKHGRIRSVPMPLWAKGAIEAWSNAAALVEGKVLRPINKGDRINGTAMSGEAIFAIVRRLAGQIDIAITPHDLRRTFAKLAHLGDAAIEQIQLSLGHASIVTTEKYLGVQQDFRNAPCDHLLLVPKWLDQAHDRQVLRPRNHGS